MLIVDRHDIANFCVAVFTVSLAVDRVTIHRGFSGGWIKAHQAGKKRLLFTFTVDIQRALYRSHDTPIRHAGDALKAPIRLTPFEYVRQPARDGCFSLCCLRPVNRQDFATLINVNQEWAILIAQPVSALTIRRNAFRIQTAVVTLQHFQRIA